MVGPAATVGDLAVVICTRNRAGQVARALDALDALDGGPVPVLVVDQSDETDVALHERALASQTLRVIEDAGRGLSRARNIGWRACTAEWIAYVDDDCLVERDWAVELRRFVSAHPDASFVSGNVAVNRDDPDLPVVSSFPVTSERRLEGRWVPPWQVGFGVNMVVRRSAIEALDGWDERLGPGVADFPASDDMDFNYRLTRAGHVVYLTPAVRAVHDQWRTPEDLGPLFEGYLAAWAGFAMKTVRSGDPLGGLWLWAIGAWDATRMLASGVRRRSRVRLRIGLHKLRGLARGTAKGATRRW